MHSSPLLQPAVADDLVVLPIPTDGSLFLHYQPIVDLGRREVVGVEALVRWQHPDRGFLLPDAFLPAAEETGAIIPLGQWVLETACHQGARWAAQGLQLDISVNLSVRQVLDPSLPDTVRRALDASGLEPSRLLLEITEEALTDHAQAGPVLDELAAMGVQVALDDFGTGHSSLVHLKRYAVAALKIDTEFVAGLGVHHDDEAIVASVASLAAALGSRCIAEGVETADQHAHLLALRCQAQGNLYSPPVPAADVAAAIDQAEAAIESAEPPGPRPRTRKPAPRLAVEAAEVMVRLHRAGASMPTIAAALNQAAAPHPKGTRWHGSSVARYLSDALAGPRTPSSR